MYVALLFTSCRQDVPDITRPPGLASPSQTYFEKAAESNELDSDTDGKEREITVYYSSYTKDIFDYIKSAYTKSHPGIKITSHYFADQWDFYEQFNTRLMAGLDVPDIVLMHSYGDKNLSHSRGNLCDLYEFMSNDPDFSFDSYYSNVFRAFEDDGKLYALPLRFSYTYAAVNNKLPEWIVNDFESRDCITHYDMVKLYNSFAEQTDKAFETNNDTEYNLIYLKRAVYNRFVDAKSKTCDFRNDEFINLLNDYKKTFEASDFSIANIQPNGVVYEDDTKQSSFYSFTIDFYQQQYRFQYMFNYDKSNFCHSIPITDENGKPVITYAELAFIPAQAKEKEVAWEFLKYLTNTETDDQFTFISLYYDFIPISKARFEDVFNYRMALFLNDSKYTLFEFNPIKLGGESTYGKGFLGGEETEVSRIFDEMNRWNSAAISPAPYYECMEVIGPVIRAFRLGEITAEQVAYELQNKITLLLNE